MYIYKYIYVYKIYIYISELTMGQYKFTQTHVTHQGFDPRPM